MRRRYSRKLRFQCRVPPQPDLRLVMCQPPILRKRETVLWDARTRREELPLLARETRAQESEPDCCAVRSLSGPARMSANRRRNVHRLRQNCHRRQSVRRLHHRNARRRVARTRPAGAVRMPRPKLRLRCESAANGAESSASFSHPGRFYMIGRPPRTAWLQWARSRPRRLSGLQTWLTLCGSGLRVRAANPQ